MGSRLFAMFKIFILIVALFLTLPLPAQEARQVLGQLSVSDLYLEPSFVFRESKQGGFDAGDSYVEFAWRDSIYTAHFQVGSAELINQPRFFAAENSGLAMTEAYAEADTDYGRFRMGLLPLCFGLENATPEAQLLFPRSLIFRERVIAIHDVGFSYDVENAGFYSQMIVHNGEGGPDLDGEMWFSTALGWKNATWNVGVSGTTGRTTPASTANVSGGNGFDGTQKSKISLANAFVQMKSGAWQLAGEGDAGQVDQGGYQDYLQGGHVDIRYSLARIPIDLLARYDVWQENWPTQSNENVEYTMGLAVHSPYRNSTVYVYGIKSIQKDVTPDSHQVKIVWKLTPRF